jgi:ribosomal protein L29
MKEIKQLIQVLEEELKKLPTKTATQQLERAINNAKRFISKAS